MAKKLAKSGASPRAKSAANKAADELAVLKPDVTLPIEGRSVTFREYGFFEGLEIAHRLSPFIDDIAKQLGAELRYDRVRRLFGVHKDLVVSAAAQSAGVEPEWVLALKGGSAELFMSTWFGVNASFFVHEAVVSLREQAQAKPSPGEASSPASPSPASATSIASGSTPNVS